MMMTSSGFSVLCCPHVVILCMFLTGLCVRGSSAACSLPLTGDWFRTSDEQTVTFSSTGTTAGHSLFVGASSFSEFVCSEARGDTYILKLPNPVSGPGSSDVVAYFCWQLIRSSSSAFLLYELSAINLQLGANNRGEIRNEGTTPTFAEVCSLSAANEVPALLYKTGSIAAAKVQCPADLLYTFSYFKDDTQCGPGSELDFCADKTTARVNYTRCSTSVLFSAGGLLNCVGFVKKTTTTFLYLHNNDATVVSPNARIVCLELTEPAGQWQATIHAKDCSATTPSHKLTLTRTATCLSTTASSTSDLTSTSTSNRSPVPEEAAGESTDIVPIIIAVVVVLLVIGAIVVILFVLKKKGIICKKRGRAVTPTNVKPSINGSVAATGSDPSSPVKTNGSAATQQAPLPATDSGPSSPAKTNGSSATQDTTPLPTESELSQRSTKLPPLGGTTAPATLPPLRA